MSHSGFNFLSMSMSKFLFLSLGLLCATTSHAQLDIPIDDISRAFPSMPSLTIQLGSVTRTGRPTPFFIDDYLRDGLLWFCLDPRVSITKVAANPFGRRSSMTARIHRISTNGLPQPPA